MSQENTTGANISITDLAQGDKRLKRVALNIKKTSDPERSFQGYALVNELNEKMFYFFCTDKFKIDEELMVYFAVAGQDLEFHVNVSSLHEQISSGRIMTAVPTPDNPFPARKFYRCFARVLTHNMNDKAAEDDAHMNELDALVSGNGGSAPQMENTAPAAEAEAEAPVAASAPSDAQSAPTVEPTVAAAAPVSDTPAPAPSADTSNVVDLDPAAALRAAAEPKAA